MTNLRLSQWLTILLLVLGLGQFAWYYPLLPEQVAAHFGPDGQPDRWEDKGSFLATLAVIYSFVVVLLLPWAVLLRHLPTSLINLPNKPYWLAPERREATLGFLTDQLWWLNAASLALLFFVFNLGLRANLQENPEFDGGSFLAVLGAYLVFIVVWTCRAVWRFRMPAEI